MRRLLALVAVAGIGILALPAGAQSSPPQPELQKHEVTAPGEVADAGYEDEVDVVEDGVGLVGLQWNGDEDVDLRVLVQSADGQWEELDDVGPSDSGPDPDSEEQRQAVERRGAEHVTEPIAVDDPSKVRVEVAGEGTATDVALVTVTTPSGDAELAGAADQASMLGRTVAILTLAGVAIALVLPGNRRRLATTASMTVLVMGFGILAAACVPAPGGVPAGPRIYSRAEWSANEAWRNCGPNYSSKVYQGIIHHTAGGNAYSPAETPGIIRGIYSYHANSLGWCDIGYNFLIDRYGSVYEGRYGGITKGVIGAHAAPFNTASFGVAIMGNYEFAAPTNASVNSLVHLMVWKMSVHGINPYQTIYRPPTSGHSGGWYDTILGHRNVSWTACPGAHLYARIGEIRSRVKPFVTAPMPFGNIDIVRAASNNRVRIAGWIIDPATPKPTNVHIYVGGPYGTGKGVYFGAASKSRPDVGAAYPAYGNKHGYDLTVSRYGPHRQVCVYAAAGPGRSPFMGCRNY